MKPTPVTFGDARLPARFWSKVQPDDSGCWLWTASLSTPGYGQYGIGASRPHSAHRVAFKALVGPIPEGLQIDHTCCVRRCVNPDHLEAVTQQENIRRGFARRRAA